MRKRTKVFLVVGCLAAVIALIIYAIRGQEPHYQGRSLSHWLHLYDKHSLAPYYGEAPPPDVEQTQAAEAVRHIGTNAIPTLLHWASYEPSALKIKMMPVLSRLPAPLKESLLYKGDYQARDAANAFFILGPQARPAIPALTRLAITATYAPRVNTCAIALASIGPEAVPALTEILTNTQTPGRYFVVSQLVRLGTNALPALPTLISTLEDKDDHTAATAACVLGQLGLKPATTIPALTQALHSTNAMHRAYAASGLRYFKAAAKPAVARLMQNLQDPDPIVRENTTNALLKIAPEVLPENTE